MSGLRALRRRTDRRRLAVEIARAPGLEGEAHLVVARVEAVHRVLDGMAVVVQLHHDHAQRIGGKVSRLVHRDIHAVVQRGIGLAE